MCCAIWYYLQNAKKHPRCLLLPTNCLSVLDHFVGLALKWLTSRTALGSRVNLPLWKTSYVTLQWFLLKFPEAVTRGCSVKKVFLEISQNSQENTCARVSFFMKHLWWLLQDFDETSPLFTKILFKHLEIKFDSNNCICACRNKLIWFENCSSKSP